MPVQVVVRARWLEDVRSVRAVITAAGHGKVIREQVIARWSGQGWYARWTGGR